MSDPLNPTVADGGLNSSDTQDWNNTRIRVPWYLSAGAIVLVGGIVFLIFVIAIKVGGIFQSKPPVAAAPTAPAGVRAAVSDKDAEIAALRQQLALLQQVQTPGGASVVPPPVYSADPAALSALSARLDRVEANQRAFARAAMIANTASAMEATARTGAPFANQLAALEPGLNDPTLVAPLKPYADKGVPTEVDLAVRYRRAAAAANIAAKGDSRDTSLVSKALHALGSFISIRRTDNTDGQGTEAVLQLAETRMNNGDLAGAVAHLDTLKPAAHKAMEPWLADAKARLLVNETTSRIVASALGHLAQAGADPAAAANGAAL